MGIKFNFGDIKEVNLNPLKSGGDKYTTVALAVSHDEKKKIVEKFPTISSYLRIGTSLTDAILGDNPRFSTSDFIRIRKIIDNIGQVIAFVDSLPDPDFQEIIERLAQFK